MISRPDGRKPDEIRPVKITRNFLKYPEGSVLIEMGDTKVVCTASVEENVPLHKKGTGSGWITAEYAMLPRSTQDRIRREGEGKSRGRHVEIQRLIGRALRAVANMDLLGERTILIDADVIQADGGTRTAAITGAFTALYDAVNFLLHEGKIQRFPLKEFLAAVSVGLVEGTAILDLNYTEDSSAAVDMNVVMTEKGKLVEIQGTAEAEPFLKETLNSMLALAEKGIKELIQIQREALKICEPSRMSGFPDSQARER